MKDFYILEGIDINNPDIKKRFGTYSKKRDAEARKLVLSVLKPDYRYVIRR